MTHIKTLYSELTSLKTYEPTEPVNRLFLTFVDSIINKDIIGNLGPRRKKKLQSICAQAESKLEFHWAKKIIHANDPEHALTLFPYLKNYKKLTALELKHASALLKSPPKSILFCGGGPLPLTAYFLAKEYGIRVSIIDKDPSAVSLGKALLKALHCDDLVTYSQADACSYNQYGSHCLVFVAALVAETKRQQHQLFSNISKQQNGSQLTLARSARGMRTLLYRELDPSIYRYFETHTAVHPEDDVINSVVLFRHAHT